MTVGLGWDGISCCKGNKTGVPFKIVRLWEVSVECALAVDAACETPSGEGDLYAVEGISTPICRQVSTGK